MYSFQAVDFNNVASYHSDSNMAARSLTNDVGLLVALQPWEDSTLQSAVVVGQCTQVCRLVYLTVVAKQQVFDCVLNLAGSVSAWTRQCSLCGRCCDKDCWVLFTTQHR